MSNSILRGIKLNRFIVKNGDSLLLIVLYLVSAQYDDYCFSCILLDGWMLHDGVLVSC